MSAPLEEGERLSARLSMFNGGCKDHDSLRQHQQLPGDKFLVSAGTGEGACGVVDIVQQGGGEFALLHGE